MAYVTLDCRFDTYAPNIAKLWDESISLSPQTLTKFLIEQEGNIAIYYIPFELVNPDAKVMIVGLTPGQTQVKDAYRVAKDGLSKGFSTIEILERIKSEASFSGTMRTNLIRMLDGIGLHEKLDIPTSDLLFSGYADLLHSTSIIRFPVFKDGKNYTNFTIKIFKSSMLRPYIFDCFLKEVQIVSKALIVPLGVSVTKALNLLVEDGKLDSERCLLGFPNPSGLNGHRESQYKHNKDALRAKVMTWFS